MLVSDLKPLGGFHKPATTKAGRLSMTGRLSNGQKAKVYSLFSPDQGALRLALQRLQPIEGLHWPAILAHSNTLVAEEWIDGLSLNKLPRAHLQQHADTVKAFLQACQTSHKLQALADQHQGAFCYINHYLLTRLQPWAHWQPVAHLLQHWQQASNAVAGTLPRQISHPDLSLANLVVQRHTGKLFVIDNELLGVGPGWVLDGNNSFCKHHPMEGAWSADVQRYAKVAWRMRLVGSALDAGQFAQAAELALGAAHD